MGDPSGTFHSKFISPFPSYFQPYSINLALLQPQPSNPNLLASSFSYLPTIFASCSNQGEALISTVPTQEVLTSIREHPTHTVFFLPPIHAVLHSSLFDNAWNRVRGYSDSMSSGVGVGSHEAKHWHRHAYGGIVKSP